MNEIIKKNGVKFGIASGLISILITTLMYSINIESFGNTWIGILIIIFYICLGIYVIKQSKKDLNGFISFKDAFTVYFIYCVIGIIMSQIFNYILFNFIDAEAKQTILDISIKKTVSILEKFNSPKQAINDAVKELKNNDPYTIVNIIKGSAISTLFSSVIGLILAAIFKSKTNEI